MVADEFHINKAHFLLTAKCEDPGLIPDKQSAYIRQDGTKEPSFGIFMIDQEYHPEIPLASSTEVLWASEWAAKQWVAGRASAWTCWRHYQQVGWPTD